MQKFFVGVISAVLKTMLTGNPDATNDEVQAVLKGFIREAVEEGVREIPDQIDAMDGKMGNLQEQVMQMPGQVIGGVIGGVVTEIRKIIPFGLGR